MRTTLIACAVATAALFVSVAPTETWAQDQKMDRARQHYQRGVQLFNEANYKGAIAEFAAADGIAPSPILEYNMALCYDRLGERDEALRRYRLYLKRVPSANNRELVEKKIARIEKAISDESAVKKEPTKPDYETLPDDPDVDNHDDGGGDLTPIPDKPPAKTDPPDGPSTTAKTGDPDLDRVSGIDVASIRDERGLGASTAPPPPGGGNDADPPPSAPLGDPGDRPKPTPIYKKWWFWVVVGVSAIILIDIASSGSNNNDTAARVFDPSLDQRFGGMGRSEGLTIRF